VRLLLEEKNNCSLIFLGADLARASVANIPGSVGKGGEEGGDERSVMEEPRSCETRQKQKLCEDWET